VASSSFNLADATLHYAVVSSRFVRHRARRGQLASGCARGKGASLQPSPPQCRSAKHRPPRKARSLIGRLVSLSIIDKRRGRWLIAHAAVKLHYRNEGGTKLASSCEISE